MINLTGKRRDKPLHYTKGLFSAAIAELKVSLDTMETNEPINRKEGNKAQADLEKENAADYRAAIRELRAKKKCSAAR
jgi:hypothetical protein